MPLERIAEHFLGVFEDSEECKDLRAKIINDDFEKKIGDYIVACEAINEIADAYFISGFKIGAELVCDMFRPKIEAEIESHE